MARKAKSKKSYDEGVEQNNFCSLPEVRSRDLSHVADMNRLSLIFMLDRVWVNGTNLRYYFFKEPASWRGGSDQEKAVRNAFKTWKDIGIGLTFEEVDDPSLAEIRIGFQQGGGSWSYLGRDSVDFIPDPNDRTMNFGWDLTTPYGRDTALHEIGHAMGFPHEHQNPNAGIVWDEEKVINDLAGPPNFWPPDKTKWNILRKLPTNTVDGSNWDKDSIMHYQFGAGLILQPPEYQTSPLIPAPGLSQVDIDTVRRLYPPIEERLSELRPFESQRFTIEAGEQVDFAIKPTVSKEYTIETFGVMDTVMVLFEVIDGTPEYMDGDDDSGEDFNAKIVARLHRDREYIVRTRLYFSRASGSGAIMLFDE